MQAFGRVQWLIGLVALASVLIIPSATAKEADTWTNEGAFIEAYVSECDVRVEGCFNARVSIVMTTFDGIAVPSILYLYVDSTPGGSGYVALDQDDIVVSPNFNTITINPVTVPLGDETSYTISGTISQTGKRTSTTNQSIRRGDEVDRCTPAGPSPLMENTVYKQMASTATASFVVTDSQTSETVVTTDASIERWWLHATLIGCQPVP